MNSPPSQPRNSVELPPEVEERCYEIWFDRVGDDRTRALDELCSDHPQCAGSIRALAARLRQGDGALGQLRSSVEEPEITERLGPYEIVGELGSGGFGTVFRALQHEPVRRVVALKLLQPGRHHERAIARFALERQALARMQHPSITHVYDAGTAPDGRPFIAMELVDGDPITAHCDERRLDVDARLRLFVDVCGGVTHAHQRGIVHRDLKPSNVLVIDRDGDVLPKIIDFGVAKALDEELGDSIDATVEGGFVGTPGYTSPEQATGGTVDTRTDVHALGVLLHELLTGDLPFDRERMQSSSLVEALRIVAEEEPSSPGRTLRAMGPRIDAVAERRSTTPRRLIQRVRGDLDGIVLRALERDVEQRYPSVEALADDVGRFLDGLPVSARRPTLGYLVGKLARRHRFLVSGFAVLLIALVGTAAVVSWSLFEVSAARDVAVAEGHRAAWNEYAAHIAAAKLALDKGDATGARRLLDHADARFRGWEHAVLAGLCDDALLALDPDEPVRSLLWTADGHVAAFPYEGGVEIWDLERGEVVAGIDGQHGYLEKFVSLGDGRHAVTARRGRGTWQDPVTGERYAVREVELVDVVERRVVRRLLECRDDVHALAVSQDGAWFACYDDSRTLARGRIDGAGEPVRWEDVKLPVTALAFWPDNESLILGTVHGLVARAGPDRRLVDPRFSVVAYEPHQGAISKIIVDPQRGLLVTGDQYSRIVVWELETGAVRRIIPVAAQVQEMLLDAGAGTLYASGGYSEPMVAAWNIATGEALGTFDGHELGVEGLALSPDRTRLATSDRAGGLRVWVARPRPDALKIELGYDCRSLDLTPAGDRAVTCSTDGHVRVFDPRGWEVTLDVDLGEPLESVASGGDHVFAAAWDGMLRRIDVVTGEVEGEVRVAREQTPGRALTATADGRLVALANDQRRLLVLDGRTLEVVWERGLSGPCSAMEFTPSGAELVVTHGEGVVEIVDARSGTPRVTRSVSETGLYGIAFSPNADRLAVACSSGEVLVLDADRLTELLRIPAHSEAAFGACFSPDGTRLATAGLDRRVRIFDVGTGTELLVLDAPRSGVDDVRFLPDGKRLIVRSHRWLQLTWLFVWDARAPAEQGR